ncbi:MAG: serine hydrolase domain-containing protein [Sinimarinibacterium flocculans]|uniref:serine hydrolase domain-containing protein n=1 Tax=Sinimarinibacterium flocculans TaxID=985250 RepID=UPI003C604539
MSDPPNEGVILAEELVHIVERSGLYSLPSDPTQVLTALSTLPDGLGDVIAMHLGRLYPTPDEFTPGMGPLLALLQARANLLLGLGQPVRVLEDTAGGELSILLLPMDATTVIVILPTQVVKANPAAAALPATPMDLSQLTYEVNGNTRTLEQYMQSGSTNAIAFMHNGRFIYDDYQNGFNTNTRAHMWSVTKSVTTALVGIAVSEGLVDSIHDPVTKYIPEATGTVWEGVSVEDLLQMESGTYWVDVPVHQPEELVLMGADYHSNGLFGMTRDEYLLRLTRVSPTGDHYRYNSGDAQMLAWLLENVYARPYAEILSEKIWQPAGMQDDALVMVDRLGNTFASMGLMATPRDMLRFGEIYRNGGRSIDGRQIVPQDWVAASHNYDKANGGGPRGYMWPHWGGEESGNYTAAGYGHQRVSVAPSLNMVGVRFGNDPVDSIAPKEWEAVLTAVGNYLEHGVAQ